MVETSQSHVSPSSIRYGQGLAVNRSADVQGDVVLPEGATIVSADTHWSVSDDIFYERAPKHLQERMPRFVRDGDKLDILVNGKPLLLAPQKVLFSGFESLPGCMELGPRLHDMDAEGVSQEIVFGNGIGAFYTYPDLEVREWVFRIYNEHLAEMAAEAPGRFYGVGLLNYWDPAKSRESMSQLKGLGIKTFLMPMGPKGADGVPMDYCDPSMDYVWEVIEEGGLPFCFHVGEFSKGGPGGLATTIMSNLSPFRKPFAEMIFGGILDRHPGIQVVFVEGDLNWIPGALQTADMLYESFYDLLDPKPLHEPAYYWKHNCHATFMYDPAGMRFIDDIGPDRAMWSSDYPHVESTFGYSWKSMKAVLDAVSPEDARKMLGDNAKRLFDLN
jgi:predicted TIM-barrel fold metal-dependent hydrolase